MSGMDVLQLPLPTLIYAAAYDAGERSRRAGRRGAWSRTDFNAAAKTQNELIEKSFGEGPVGSIKYSIAIALQNEGVLHLGMKRKAFFKAVEDSYQATCDAFDTHAEGSAA